MGAQTVNSRRDQPTGAVKGSIMNDLIPFSYEGTPVRVLDIEGEPWVVARDVCNVLGIANHNDALSRLDDDEKGVGTTDTLGGPQQMAIISEPGIWSLAMTSRKPNAKPFVHWLAHDVVPSIRRTGSYVAPVSREQQLAQAVVLAQQVLAETEATVRELTPKAQSFDHFLSAVNDYSVAVVAQALNRAGAKTGRNCLFGDLEQLGWVYKPEGHRQWRLYQRFADQGLAVVRMGKYEDQNTGEVHATYTIRITPKGLHRLAQHFGVTINEEDLTDAAA